MPPYVQCAKELCICIISVTYGSTRINNHVLSDSADVNNMKEVKNSDIDKFGEIVSIKIWEEKGEEVKQKDDEVDDGRVKMTTINDNAEDNTLLPPSALGRSNSFSSNSVGNFKFFYTVVMPICRMWMITTKD